MVRNRMVGGAAALVAVLALAGLAQAQPCCQVNISGATLFVDFFKAPASTNDYVDVDGDGFSGFDPNNPDFVDQLAQPLAGCTCPTNSHWLVHYRGVGSGNGLAELVNFACSGTIPVSIPSDIGYLNRYKFAELGGIVAGCTPCNASGVPICPTSVDMAVMDVPTPWFVVAGSAANANWQRKPGEDGYGRNPLKSWDAPTQGQTLKSLGCLNIDTVNPNASTVYDTQVAWVPVAIIANRGTGLENVRASELQYLFGTGRLPNGENIVAATRDAGSGTRNAGMNGLCVDPSYGRGDNLGVKSADLERTKLGPVFVPTNCDGSGIMEDVVKNHRLAVGYTGLAGGSRAAGDAAGGRYEILNVMFDTLGGGAYVRPTVNSVLDNCDPNTGYPIGGNETFATVGNPFEIDGNSPTYMDNQCAADYLRNIVSSIAATVAQPGGDASFFMPGEFLAKDFFLAAAVDCLPSLTNPCDLQPNQDLNAALQEWTRLNNGMGIGSDTPAYGLSVANKVPVRKNAGITWPTGQQCDCAYPADGQYSDGSTGNYINRHNGATIAGGGNLNLRNRIAGDFDGNGLRNINDVEKMMEAIFNPTAYVLANSVVTDPVVPEIIGDFNGDGNFDCRDVRYFCDGLAINPGTGDLDRAAAFLRVDQKWLALTGNDDNYFNTTIYACDGVTPRPWILGASAYDVAGNTAWPGAQPHGYDCKVTCADAEYVWAHTGDWTDLDQAIGMDLSADMNGDLVVDYADVDLVQDAMGCICIAPPICRGDCNCDGNIGFADIDFFVAAIPSNEAAWRALFPPPGPTCTFANCDVDGDGNVAFADIDPFVAKIPSVCP